MEEQRSGRVICWRKNLIDSFFIVYSKRTSRFIERFQCNNGVLRHDGFSVVLGQCYSVKYARQSEFHAIIYELKIANQICDIRKDEENESIYLKAECTWELAEKDFFCQFGRVLGIPSRLMTVTVWCQLMRGNEIHLEFVDFDDNEDNSESVEDEDSCSSIAENIGNMAIERRNSIKGFNLKGNLVTIVSGDYSCFTRNEMAQLFKLAENYCDGRMYPFDFLHRCKPKKYFDDICAYPGAMMWPYMKDKNGHKQSPINRNISGLFFNTAAMCNMNNSPYGNVQLVMSASEMLDIDKMDLYFADFYCNEVRQDARGGGQGSSYSSVLHYLTIVVCPKTSTINKFCNEYLILLNPHENKFLKTVASSNGREYFTAYKSANNVTHRQELMVEVFYTEPVSLYAAEKVRKIDTFGRGRSLPNGLPNNKSCDICNI